LESFPQAYERYLRRHPELPKIGRSAYFARTAWRDLDTSRVTQWPNHEVMQQRFEQLRDERFMPDPNGESFPRRISWLYPDDGCFARAGMLKRLASQYDFPLPSRVFTFGSLEARTPNHPKGKVEWWYHTAALVKVDGQVFVLDPALEPRHPLPLREWCLKQVEDIDDVRLSVCKPDTYGPSTSCTLPPNSDGAATQHQPRFLRAEWERQKRLWRDPRVVLGDRPPWLEGS
jgi:hypothetical protein